MKTLNSQQLQQYAKDLLEEKGLSQADATRKMGIAPPTLSIALNSDNPSRYAGTLKRLIETYTDYKITSEKIHTLRYTH